jgi:hypothetical protein
MTIKRLGLRFVAACAKSIDGRKRTFLPMGEAPYPNNRLWTSKRGGSKICVAIPPNCFRGYPQSLSGLIHLLHNPVGMACL